MKTTIDIPDALLMDAKKRAVELRVPLRRLVIAGLQREIRRAKEEPGAGRTVKAVRWVTVGGPMTADLDVSSRERMHEWLRRHA